RNADEIAAADDAVGRVELDPARARQIDLNPGMGRAGAGIAVRGIRGNEQIAGYKAGGDAEPAQRLDHEQGKVAAGARTCLQGVKRMLRALLMPFAIDEGVP